MNALTCSKCGVHRPQELNMTLERSPCLNYGATSLTFTVSMPTLLNMSPLCALPLPGFVPDAARSDVLVSKGVVLCLGMAAMRRRLGMGW